MKNASVEIIKKNRKYFQAKFENSSFVFKLLIDNNSEHLTEGVCDLILEDISVRSKYGTDIIYKVLAENKEPEKIVTLKHFKYNELLVQECKKLGGKWDAEEKAWIFPVYVESEVEELDYIYNSELVNIDLEVDSEESISAYHGPITFLGYSIARATGRDSGATLSDHVSLIQGKISSGGSMKNWRTYASGRSIFRLQVPIKLLQKYEDSEFKFTILK